MKIIRKRKLGGNTWDAVIDVADDLLSVGRWLVVLNYEGGMWKTSLETLKEIFQSPSRFRFYDTRSEALAVYNNPRSFKR